MRARLFWVEADLPGRLAIAPRPQGGEFLGDEMAGWAAEGVTRIVRLLEPAEIAELQLREQATACATNGIRLHDVPIPDRGLPATDAKTRATISDIIEAVKAGDAVVIHCRAGIGRSSIIAAAALCGLGLEPDDALDRLSKARRVTIPDTDEQRAWVLRRGWTA